MNLNFLKSAFDRIGTQSKQLEQIAAASETTAAAVTAGGVLYTKVDEMVVLLRQIAENGMGLKTEALKDAKVLGLVGKATEPLGKGFQLIVAALNELPDADEATKKMDALVGGLVKLKDVGSSILQFAGYMALSAPLLMLAAIASPFLLLSLFAVTKGLEMVSNRVDSESIEKFKMLGDVGKSILLLGGSLALFGLIGPLAVKGAFFAGISLLMVGGTFRLLNSMDLDPETFKQNVEALSDVGKSMLLLGGSLALFGLIGPLAVKGAFFAGVSLLMVGGTFRLLNAMGLDPETLKTFKQNVDILSDTGKSILLLGGSLALFGLIGPLAVKGAFFAGISLLMVGGTFRLLDAMGLDPEALETFKQNVETLSDVGKSILLLGGSLALFGLIGPLAVKGAIFAGISLLIVGGTFRLLEAMKLDAEKFKQNADTLGSVGLGLLALGGSLALIGALSGLIFKGAIVAGLAIIAIGGAFWALEKMGITDKIEEGAKGLSFAALSILALGVSFALFEMVAPPPEKILKIGMIVAGTAVAFGIVGIFGDTIVKGAKAMGFVALSILAIGLSLYLFDMLVPGDILSMETLKAFVVVGALGAGFYLAGKGASTIVQGALSMMVAGVALIVIGAGVHILNNALPTENAWERIGQMGAIIGGLGLAMAAAGASGGLVALGAVQMLIAGVALIPIAMGIAALNDALPDENPWERIGLMGAVIGGLALAMTGAGALSPLILVGSAAMIVAGVALLTIGAGITVLSALDWPKMMGKGGVFGDSGQTGFFGGVKSNLEVALDAIADGISINPITLAGMLMGAPAFILAGVALLTIGKGISKFQKIAEKADLPSLGANIDTIVTALSDSFARIGTLYPGGSGSIFSGGSVVAQGVSATLGMGRALTGIARGMQAMANLQFPVEFDKEGNPIKFESMSSDAPAKVAANAGMITSVLANVFGQIGKDYPGGKAGLFSSIFGSGKQSPVADGISAVMGMGDALAGIAMGVQAMADLKFPTKWGKDGKPIAFESVDIKSAMTKVGENVNLILLGDGTFGGLVSIFANVGKANGPDKGWFTSTDYEKGVEMIQGIGTPILNLAKGVQMMADLKFPTGFDKDGNPTGFEKIDNVDGSIQQVQNNIKKILLGADGTGGLVGIFKQLGAEDDSGWFSSSTIKKGSEIAAMIADPIKNIADATTTLMEGNWDATDAAEKIKILVGALTSSNDVDKDLLNHRRWLWNSAATAYEKMGGSIPGIISAVNGIDSEKSVAFKSLFLGEVDPKDPTSSYNAQKWLWKRLGEAMPSIGDGMSVTSEAINNMDLERLTEARTMFEALATLTHGGDANDILSKMGESLEEALQNLAEMLGEFKDTVEDGNAGSQNMVDGLKDTLASLKTSIMPTTNTQAAPTVQQQNVDVSGVIRAIQGLEEVLVQQGVKINQLA